MGDEMDLRTFIESTWFKGVARGAMIIGVPALTAISGFVGFTLSDVQSKNVTLRADVTEIQRTQQQRADVNDRFQSDVAHEFAGVKAAQSEFSQKMTSVQVDVATIKGILQEMQRQSVAAASFAQPKI